MERQEILDKLEEMYEQSSKEFIGSNETDLDFKEKVSYWIHSLMKSTNESHAHISNVTICDTEPEEIKRMNDMQNELAAAMLLSATSKVTKYGQPQGDNKKPKKKKRKRNKKTHR